MRLPPFLASSFFSCLSVKNLSKCSVISTVGSCRASAALALSAGWRPGAVDRRALTGWMALHLRLRARSIQPKFPEISVQNSMDRFGPTGKVSKKRVHLLRWTSFPGRTRWNFGWMDRALRPQRNPCGPARGSTLSERMLVVSNFVV